MKPFNTINVERWIEKSRAMLDKPILHHEEFWAEDKDFMIKLFDGPTPKERSDFHINSSPEFFYQLKGEMYCRVIEHDAFVDITVGESDMFLLPSAVPHLNTREEGSIGLVIHQKRPPGATDAIAWYCERCCHLLHRVDYVFEDLRAQLPGFIRGFLADERLRTCGRCGTVMAADRGYF
jgi:3-hydroxyanthranilate 3,4-dioxygenase